MDKVQEMLSDPESMKQIQELADMLTSETGNNDTSQQNNNTTQNNSDIPPNSMFNNLFGNNDSNNSTDSTSNSSDSSIDFGMIFQLMQLFNSTSNSQDEKLLLAIKPYLNNERQSKVDKAIKLMKAYEIFTTAKESGLLNNLDNII